MQRRWCSASCPWIGAAEVASEQAVTRIGTLRISGEWNVEDVTAQYSSNPAKFKYVIRYITQSLQWWSKAKNPCQESRYRIWFQFNSRPDLKHTLQRNWVGVFCYQVDFQASGSQVSLPTELSLICRKLILGWFYILKGTISNQTIHSDSTNWIELDMDPIPQIFLLMTAHTPDSPSSSSWITLYPDLLSPLTDKNNSWSSPGTAYASVAPSAVRMSTTFGKPPYNVPGILSV
jgi:hypothetical protein